ncbi:MAG: EAL domain-containing protein [Gammaproteobacteria bacterium]|nr:EAL domain-containing protein [Gammaproteobacteria bacterium]
MEPARPLERDTGTEFIDSTDGFAFRVLFTDSVFPVIVYDRKTLQFLDVNPAAIQYYGYTREEFLQKIVTDIILPEDAPRFLNSIGQNPEHVPHMGEWRHRGKDGRVNEVQITRHLLEFGGRHVWLSVIQDITERKQAETALRDSREKLDRLLNSMGEGVYEVDTNGNCTFVNRAFLQILGYQNADEVLGQHMHELIHHSHPDGSLYPSSECRMYRAYQIGQITNASDEVFWRKDGAAVPVEYWSRPIMTDGVVTGAMATFIDISERKRQQALLSGEKQVLEMLARNSPLAELLDRLVRIYEEQYEGGKFGAVLLLDTDGTHLRVGGAPSLPDGFRRQIDRVITDPHAGSQESRMRDLVAVSDIASDPHCDAVRDEALRHGLHTCWSTPILSAKGAKLGAFAVYLRNPAHPTVADRELLERSRQLAAIAIEKYRDQESLATMAYYDVLTGLPNRVLLLDRLRQAMIEARRHNRLAALLFLDLDRFKNINDTLGHEMGDLMLHKVAQRLQECVRPGDTVARPGGDEFIIVLASVAHVDDVSRVAQKIIDVFSSPFEISGQELFVTCSIGITLYPFDDQDIDALYRNADAAMYHAKDEGGNNFQFYSAEMNAQTLKRLSLENALRHALERDEFRLYYQPQVDVLSDRIIGAEALIRWQHPEWGLVPPLEFIPLAEETGLIVPIGEWVLRTACAQARAWQDAGLVIPRVAVNLSARQFRQPRLLDVIMAALRQTGLAPERLEIELTESLVMRDVDRNIDVLQGLKRMGVAIAIDDFGTGYSSLSYLRRLPIDVIKIDRSFIEHIPDNPDDASVAVAIMALAKSLQLKTVAEGVETSKQLDFLHRHGCDTAQGYYHARPLPAEDFVRFLHQRPKKPD